MHFLAYNVSFNPFDINLATKRALLRLNHREKGVDFPEDTQKKRSERRHTKYTTIHDRSATKGTPRSAGREFLCTVNLMRVLTTMAALTPGSRILGTSASKCNALYKYDRPRQQPGICAFWHELAGAIKTHHAADSFETISFVIQQTSRNVTQSNA